ncbi:hypothetical protein EW026_g7899 [Hermanssonia centrifuga]|uniref:Uncharacterized protein n=1 Tax=Hermanssonia centrifuga TaxID=98765 RepID=A0A4S4K6A5_9APHY|nr:hypothetical protein EW026_g7899 [Hermanssonia centrifuga]
MGPNLDSRFFRVEKTECAYNVGCEEISFLLEPVAHRREGKFAAHLKTIVIDIVSIFSNVEDAIVCDWNAFDNCVSRLSHLHKAVLGLYPQEHARLRFIHEVVNTKMVNLGLAAPGKLAYAIYGRDQGEDERTGDNETSDEDTADDQAQVIRIPEIPKWMKVAPGSDELEATAFGDGDLWRVYR